MTLHERSETFSQAPTGSDAADCLLEAWREALAEVLDTERRQWQRERALIEAQAAEAAARLRAFEAQAAETVATLRAEVVELRANVTAQVMAQVMVQVMARLGELKSGADGAPGTAGPQGEPGPQGERGEAGPQGERGEQGEKGNCGEVGATGARGEQGEAGAAGEQGATGERGEKGEAGATGERGEQGERGEKGEAGVAGLPGPQGAVGAPGRLSAAKAFVEGAVHYEGDVVLALGGTWQARCDTARAPPHEDWLCIAAKGRDAATPNVRGTFSEGETYAALDIVALGGSSFIARRDGPGACPGEGWQLIASAGKSGIKGPAGERGEKGEVGPRGLPGAAAPVIVGWTIDHEAYAATPILSDQSPAPPLELRALFEQFHNEAR